MKIKAPICVRIAGAILAGFDAKKGLKVPHQCGSKERTGIQLDTSVVKYRRYTEVFGKRITSSLLEETSKGQYLNIGLRSPFCRKSLPVTVPKVPFLSKELGVSTSKSFKRGGKT